MAPAEVRALAHRDASGFCLFSIQKVEPKNLTCHRNIICVKGCISWGDQTHAIQDHQLGPPLSRLIRWHRYITETYLRHHDLDHLSTSATSFPHPPTLALGDP